MARKELEALEDTDGLSNEELIARWKKKRLKERQEIIRDVPDVLERYRKAYEKVWLKWQLEFSEKAFEKDKNGTLRKMKGGLLHPFHKGVLIRYHRPSYGYLLRLRRGMVPSEAGGTE